MNSSNKKRKFNKDQKPNGDLLIPKISEPPEKILVRKEMFQLPEEISSNFSYKKFLNLSNAKNKKNPSTVFIH